VTRSKAVFSDWWIDGQNRCGFRISRIVERSFIARDFIFERAPTILNVKPQIICTGSLKWGAFEADKVAEINHRLCFFERHLNFKTILLSAIDAIGKKNGILHVINLWAHVVDVTFGISGKHALQQCRTEMKAWSA
jgi:hypothetical protein